MLAQCGRHPPTGGHTEIQAFETATCMNAKKPLHAIFVLLFGRNVLPFCSNCLHVCDKFFFEKHETGFFTFQSSFPVLNPEITVGMPVQE
jgi:hypothetical protein